MTRITALSLLVLSVAATGQARELRPERIWIPAGDLRLEATFFAERGFAVLVPMRRGRGASDGEYPETYGCSVPALAEGVERGIADVDAALAFALRQSWVDPTRVVLGGMSRGGFLSALYPSVRPVTAKGVINFAGGWTPDWCDATARFNEHLFGRAGRATLPMLWLYTENDRNYGPSAIRRHHGAFTTSGGMADLRLFPAIGHDGHDLLPRSVTVWQPAVERFLERIGVPGKP